MSRIKTYLIIFGDIILLYGALILTLVIRYGKDYFREPLANHLNPFSLIFVLWILIFFLADLYKDKNLKTNPLTIQMFTLTIAISVASSIILFYLFPSFFKLTPKTNLFIFALIFGILDFGWRFMLVKIYISSGMRNRLLIIGDSKIIDETIDHLKNNPQIGYDAVFQIKDYGQKNKEDISQIIANCKINTIVIQSHLKKDLKLVKILYKYLSAEISVMDLITFYEMIFQKLPLEEMEESWFIEKIAPHHPLYEYSKRFIDIILSLFLIIVLLPLTILIAILIKMTSKGPIVYKQERVGLNDKNFILYKFRTMVANHSGPSWTTQNDDRITPFGKIMRYTHLDEIPQLFNILKGNISFIGPRAEASKLVEIYRQLPYYDLRHIIKPGLTGWAQLNYKPSASLEEAREKLRYDIYYIKNRSLIFDLLIILKTIKYIFLSNQ